MAVPEHVINPQDIVSFKAGAALSLYDCVKLGAADGEVIKTAAANDAGIGFALQAATAAGQSVDVCMGGTCWARSSGAVTAGDDLEAVADGEVTTETPANGVDQNIVGKALTASAGANELIVVRVAMYKYNNETV